MDGTGQADGTTGGTVAADAGGPASAGHRVSAGRWVDVDGPVYYEDFGGPADGPLIVCVHGLGASHTSWWTLAPLLARRARVLVPDLAGFGRTPAAGRRTDVGSNRRLLAGFLAAVAGDVPVILVGNSMGGMISVLQAAADPGSVAGLVLLSPALPIPWLRQPDASILGMFVGMIVPRLGPAVLAHRRKIYTAEELVTQTLTRTTVDPSRIPPDAFAAMVALSKERSARPDGDAQADAALVTATRSVVGRLTWRRPLAAAVAAVAAPTLLIHGRHDRLVPVAAARHAASRRPEWRVEVLDDCGHLPQFEATDRTFALIDGWLDDAGAAGAEAARAAAIPAQRA